MLNTASRLIFSNVNLTIWLLFKTLPWVLLTLAKTPGPENVVRDLSPTMTSDPHLWICRWRHDWVSLASWALLPFVLCSCHVMWSGEPIAVCLANSLPSTCHIMTFTIFCYNKYICFSPLPDKRAVRIRNSPKPLHMSNSCHLDMCQPHTNLGRIQWVNEYKVPTLQKTQYCSKSWIKDLSKGNYSVSLRD